jgi:hypothetical protein
VPHLVRMILAGVAVTLIGAMASVGLYAVVVGGMLFGATAARPAALAAPVLVTIQAIPTTPTAIPIPSSTPIPSSLIPGLARQPGPALAAPLSTAVDLRIEPTGTPAAQMASPSSTPTVFPTVPTVVRDPASPVAQVGTSRQAVHDGVTLEIVDVQRGWQPDSPGGLPSPTRTAGELFAVQVRLTNGAVELRFAADLDLALVLDDGARLAPRPVPPLREPHLLTLPMLAGDAVRGWLTYQVPAGSSARSLQWSPTRPDRPRAEATYLLALP